MKKFLKKIASSIGISFVYCLCLWFIEVHKIESIYETQLIFTTIICVGFIVLIWLDLVEGL